MAKPVKYKRPRKINVVSVSIALVLLLLGFLAYQYLPAKLREGEAYRILDETASQFAPRKSRYFENPGSLTRLKADMGQNLRMIGIKDPQMEHWIEIDSKHQVRFGVLYSEWTTWPFDIIEKQERVVEKEYTLTLH